MYDERFNFVVEIFLFLEIGYYIIVFFCDLSTYVVGLHLS